MQLTLPLVSTHTNNTASTEIYTLSLHDALPISPELPWMRLASALPAPKKPLPYSPSVRTRNTAAAFSRSEEHTSELQSQFHLVCRLLLEKKTSFGLG